MIKKVSYILILLLLILLSCKSKKSVISVKNEINHIDKIEKDSIFKKDILKIVEELEFMYGYDQILRKYLTYKTFNKQETDSIEKLPDSLISIIINKRKFSSDSLKKNIMKKYIIPKDNEHTERLIAITKKYGFPSIQRIKKYYKKDFKNTEFNPVIIFIHAQKKYWNELKNLIQVEFENKRINRCAYGYLLWHFNGRKNIKYMLDNGFELKKDKTGKTRLEATNCD